MNWVEKKYTSDKRRRRPRTDVAAREKLKEELLSILTYELKAPLAPLRNTIEVLRSICTDPLQNHALSIADRQVSQLSRLVNDLTEAATPTRRVVTLETQSVDLAMLANQALENVRPLIDARKQHLRLVLPSTPVVLECDPARLLQMLEALLDSAAHHAAEGGSISLSIAPTDELTIAVSDDGPGIGPERLPFIFNFFARRELGSHQPGAGVGIGLAIVRNLVEIHRGSIHADSAGPGRGSTFTVRLPLPSATRTETNAPPTRLTPTPHRILVIDDNVDLAESLAVWLRLRGNTVRTAYDGLSGLSAAQEFHPNVVVTDVELPGAHGSVVVKELSRSSGMAHTVLIAMSGSTDESVRERLIEAGAHHYLVKPVEPEHLLTIIENSLSSFDDPS